MPGICFSKDKEVFDEVMKAKIENVQENEIQDNEDINIINDKNIQIEVEKNPQNHKPKTPKPKVIIPEICLKEESINPKSTKNRGSKTPNFKNDSICKEDPENFNFNTDSQHKEVDNAISSSQNEHELKSHNKNVKNDEIEHQNIEIEANGGNPDKKLLPSTTFGFTPNSKQRLDSKSTTKDIATIAEKSPRKTPKEPVQSNTDKIFGNITHESFINQKMFTYSKDYKMGKILGEGAYGKVALVKHKHSGVVRAMKIIKKNSVKPEQKAKLFQEVEILKC